MKHSKIYFSILVLVVFFSCQKVEFEKTTTIKIINKSEDYVIAPKLVKKLKRGTKNASVSEAQPLSGADYEVVIRETDEIDEEKDVAVKTCDGDDTTIEVDVISYTIYYELYKDNTLIASGSASGSDEDGAKDGYYNDEGKCCAPKVPFFQMTSGNARREAYRCTRREICDLLEEHN